MAARSFVLDLFQMTHGEFLQEYNWSNFSEGDFFRLRAQLADSPHSTVLWASTEDPAELDWTTTFDNTVLTRLYFKVFGTEVQVTIDLIAVNGGINQRIILSTDDGSYPSEVDISGVELTVTSIAVTVDAGTPLLFTLIYGYTPPTTNP